MHQKSSVFRGKIQSCDVIIYLHVLNLKFDLLNDDEEQHFEPGQLRKFKRGKFVLPELFWFFNLGALSMRALKGEFWLIQLQQFKTSQLLAICLAPIVGIAEGNI